MPSTFLWHRSIDDLRVNSLWQRLRRSILLLLQLCVIALVALALVRPGWSGSQLLGSRFVFLIDTSASMSSLDGSPTRLDEAKRRARELIDQMAGGDVAMIVSFSDSARVEQSFTDSRRELERKLAAIEPTARATRLDEALRVAAGLANPAGRSSAVDGAPVEGLPATVYIFSDGVFPNVDNFDLGNLHPLYVPIGDVSAANVGITAFNTRRREGRQGDLQAFARLENFGSVDVLLEVELLRDGTLIDARRVQIAPHTASGVAFDLADTVRGALELVIRPGGALRLDDHAWTAIEPARQVNVLCVTAGNEALVRALKTDKSLSTANVEIVEPEFLESQRYHAAAAAGNWSLVIFDRCQPQQMPQANTLFIGAVPPDTPWSAGAVVEAPQIIDVNTAHPLLEWIDLSNVRFAEGMIVRPPAGATVLIDTAEGALMAIAPRGGFEDAALGAAIVAAGPAGSLVANTDWPLRLSFPVFVLNTLAYLGGTDELVTTRSIQPGAIFSFRTAGDAQTADLQAPNGEQLTLERRRGEAFQVNSTDELGMYEIKPLGQPPSRFVVNLFDSAESAISTRSEFRVGASEIKGQVGWEGARRELWKALLLGALGVLCLEWYIYVRRSSPAMPAASRHGRARNRRMVAQEPR